MLMRAVGAHGDLEAVLGLQAEMRRDGLQPCAVSRGWALTGWALTGWAGLGWAGSEVLGLQAETRRGGWQPSASQTGEVISCLQELVHPGCGCHLDRLAAAGSRLDAQWLLQGLPARCSPPAPPSLCSAPLCRARRPPSSPPSLVYIIQYL